jgi:hypothetical protein
MTLQHALKNNHPRGRVVAEYVTEAMYPAPRLQKSSEANAESAASTPR